MSDVKERLLSVLSFFSQFLNWLVLVQIAILSASQSDPSFYHNAYFKDDSLRSGHYRSFGASCIRTLMRH